jgi:outer membrane immunogenic protein
MKSKIKLTALVVAAISCGTSIAQTNKNAWEGVYGQLGLVGYESYIPVAANGTTTTPSGHVLPTFTTANHSNGPAANIATGYNFAINQTYLIGIGAALYPGHSRSASTTATNAGGVVSGTYNVSNVFSIFLTPSYAIDQEKLAYVKIGYTGATVNSSASGNAAGNFPEQKTQMSGMVYGLGYKQIISGSIYGFAEANYAIDKAKQVAVTTDDGLVVNSTAKASGYDVLFGIGYRF